MIEYYGKRGISVSVEVFISKSFSTYIKQVYLVALDRCDQDMLQTLCIAEIVLDQFSKDCPHIKEIKIKTDNAGDFLAHHLSSTFVTIHYFIGNYHANGVPECMNKLASDRGILLSAYDYNEAQLVSSKQNISIYQKFTPTSIFREKINATGRLHFSKCVRKGGF